MSDAQFLHHAVNLAMLGRGSVEPNPMVGCVVVRDGMIIGEGYHSRFGGPHAEPLALGSCKAPAEGSTVYVTLEPCCHTDKKTPPCVPLLIAAQVRRVVVGTIDPNPKVCGHGIAQLRDAGIIVELVNDPACRQLIAPFVAATILHRPYLTIKWAQTADAKVAGPSGRRLQISGAAAQRATHALRARSDAILIGIGTARVDDPLLTARNVTPIRSQLRIVLDCDLRLPLHSRLIQTVGSGRVIVFCSKESAHFSGTRAVLAAVGVEIHPVSLIGPGRLDLQQVISEIFKLNVNHLLIEPGPTLAAGLFDACLWDRLWIFRSRTRLADPTAPCAANVPSEAILVKQATLDDDELSEYLNPAGAFSGSFPSADFMTL